MKTYIPSNDNRNVVNEYAYDEDRRLCEIVGCDILIDNIRINDVIYNITVPELYLNGHRQFIRYIRKHGIRPYIKIRKIISNKIIGMCRLSIFEPKFITGYNENMKLDTNIISEIINILSKDDSNLRILYPNLSIGDKNVWTHMLLKINENYKMCNIHYKLPLTLTIPDYTKLVDVKK